MKNNIVKSTLLALALVGAPLAVGVVSAQTAAQPSAQATKANYTNFFLAKLASSLGVTQDKLSASLKAASNATVDEALKNQDITKDQAARLKQGADQGRYALFGRGLGGPDGQMGRGNDRGGFGGGPGVRVGVQAGFDAAAKALGMSSDELRTQLRSGKTVAEVAKSKNVAEKTVRDAVLAALKIQLDADVKAGRITQARADQFLQHAQNDPNFGLKFGGPGRR